jgi:hypothetical protein
MGHLQRLAVTSTIFEVVIVTPPGSPIPEQIQQTLNTCNSINDDMDKARVKIVFVSQSLSDYFSTKMAQMQRSRNSYTYEPKDYTFDYVEYNAGMSLSPLYREHLRYIAEVSRRSHIGQILNISSFI